MAALMRTPQLATGTRLQPKPVPCPTLAPRVAQRPGCNVQVKAAAATAGTVKLIIQGRKLPVTDAIRQYVESKIGHAAQHFQQTIKEVDVTLSARGGDTGTKGEKKQKVDVTIYTLRNGVVRVEDSDLTLYAAIDKAADKIERKMTRVKEKAILKGKWPGRAGPHVDKAEQEEFQEYLAEVQFFTSVSDNAEALDREFAELNAKYPATVLRQKVIALDPMSVDEAIDALEAIGHSFYVFREIESDTVQVLYKRVSEGYGIIVPTKRD